MEQWWNLFYSTTCNKSQRYVMWISQLHVSVGADVDLQLIWCPSTLGLLQRGNTCHTDNAFLDTTRNTELINPTCLCQSHELIIDATAWSVYFPHRSAYVTCRYVILYCVSLRDFNEAKVFTPIVQM